MDTNFVQTGRVHCGVDTDSAWVLNNGSGDRSFIKEIDFPIPYSVTPPIKGVNVSVMLSAMDVDNSRNTRVSVNLDQPANTGGFTLRVSTWADTILFSVEVTWIAIGTID